jgi:hypothetical protein
VVVKSRLRTKTPRSTRAVSSFFFSVASIVCVCVCVCVCVGQPSRVSSQLAVRQWDTVPETSASTPLDDVTCAGEEV